jgi:hypothetical protein
MRSFIVDIKIEIVKEHKDGSADALVHFDAEGLAVLVESGILSILRQYIEQEKNANKRKKRKSND